MPTHARSLAINSTLHHHSIKLGLLIMTPGWQIRNVES